MLLCAFIPLVSFALAVVLPRAEGAIDLPDTYLVKFKEGVEEAVREKHTEWVKSLERLNDDGTVARGLRFEFGLAFQGYSAVLDKEDLKVVRNSPEIAEIKGVGTSAPALTYLTEEKAVRFTDENVDPDIIQLTALDNVTDSKASQILTEKNKGWNTVRLSKRDYKPNGFNNGPWIHDGYLGQGVDVFVLDSGVNLKQPGFAGSKVVDAKNFVRGTNISDNQGHGTMCAGVIAGRYAGLSPKATLHNVKIADDDDRAACDSTVAGIEYVVNAPGKNNMKVISMSQTGFTGRPDVSTAVAAAVKKGVHVVVCAGNYDVDACGVQPSNAPGAIVVGSTNPNNIFPTKQTDREGTNVGRCVTIFAPGSGVPTLSTKNLDPNYHYFAWGTSIAAPQVAALIANRLSKVGAQTPEEIRNWLVGTATKNQIGGNLRGSPNLIAFSGVGEEGAGVGTGRFTAANKVPGLKKSADDSDKVD
ncbi:subtilisin-like protein [Tothia fuscella]|uniref:Subtilisin-like protein n=1 Tax=Tothia fuscella TaxID=1048955 RepID=A0A9P4NK24_9PEZI|nr:subtilisin-like protein [Tothia fuscella]